MPRGGKRPGAGRPRGSGADSHLHIRCPADELERWRRLADTLGESLSIAVRRAVNQWADRVEEELGR